ncbi:MAG: 16S rRNA (guanine(527)-N(7))-methyltransferase RsmG [Pacificimonas sp.]
MVVVSRETEAKFERYLELLASWQSRMNLVAPSTLSEARTRHIEDSAQLVDHIPPDQPSDVWLDFGAGAGFPGLVIAIMRDVEMHLVESRAKKCQFLQAVVDDLELSDRVTIHARRVEDMTTPKADILSARACAALPKLFDWGRGLAARHSLWLFPKGRTANEEVEAARKTYAFDVDLHSSRTDKEAAIVAARNVRRLDRETTRGRARRR